MGIQSCACGCGEDCKTPGSKFAHGHAGRVRPLADRFWAKVDKTDTCWVWVGATFRESGYGQIAVGPKKRRANRVAWELTYGEIPKGMLVCHKCDNPSCVRPDHLFLGTHRDNCNDMMSKQRCDRVLSWDLAKEIRERYAKGEKQNALAKELGVSPAAIWKVVNNKSWGLV